MTGDILSQIEQTQQQLRASIEQTKLQSAKSDELIRSCRGGKAEPELPPQVPDSGSAQG
ncbi:MAG TPA: hypothetical protein VGR19_03105 [Allosphingosinicella sp.]|nr:hypothetical protein [Allosphingosinicella sp.]